MRSLVGLYFVLSIYLVAHAAPAKVNIISILNFAMTGEAIDGENYQKLIEELREALTPNSKKVYSKPVLPTIAQGTNFILLHLLNYDGIQATIAIDAADVYVVASSHGRNSFFFEGVSKNAYDGLFQGTIKKYLPYGGNYDSLQRSARITREDLEVGLHALSSAIDDLVIYRPNNCPPAKAFLLIIQIISEAARFKYIEQTLYDRGLYVNFKPDPKFLSLENKWSALSKQIQVAETNKGEFQDPVQIIDSDSKAIYVSDVYSSVVKEDISLLLHPKTNQVASVSDGEPCVVGVGEYEATVATTIPSDRRCGNAHRKWLGNGKFKVMEGEKLHEIPMP